LYRLYHRHLFHFWYLCARTFGHGWLAPAAQQSIYLRLPRLCAFIVHINDKLPNGRLISTRLAFISFGRSRKGVNIWRH
jgi:hypothetical protein